MGRQNRDILGVKEICSKDLGFNGEQIRPMII